MQSGDVFHHGLVAVAPKALVPVETAQLPADASGRAFNELRILESPGGIADHRKAGAVHLFAGGFAREKPLQRSPETHHRTRGDQDGHAAIAVCGEEIHAVQSLQGSLRHADRAGIAFWQSVVALVSPFPDAVIGGLVGPGDVINQVLNEGRLVAVVDHGQTTAAQLGQLEQKE